ncbi:MAG: ASCH domain-containing protein [Candidatus Moranbacteria bacterium]|nr:ASCH domain-containing protein [Candidatus Moranbacteria bacterium]
MIHIIGLQLHSFNQIKEGIKTIEARLLDEKRRKIKLGDIIEIKLEPDRVTTIRVEVVGLLNYKTFLNLINDFPITAFGDDTKEAFLARTSSFYTPEQEKKYSVLGIKIQLINV